MSGEAVADGGTTTRREPSAYAAPPWWLGTLAALLVPPALTAVLDQLRQNLNLTGTALLFLAAVVAVARLGGLYSALAAALWASLLLNYYFVFPLHSPAIADANDAIALAVFVIVALTVASVVDLAARQSRRAARANAEAETLNALSLAVLRGDGALGALLDQLRDAFDTSAVSLLQQTRDPDEQGWRTVAASGPEPPPGPEAADTLVPVEPGAVLALRGRVLGAADRHVLSAFTAQATAALERARLAESAAAAATLQAADKMRTALLAAVSHDLRSPLAAARAATNTLSDPELALSQADRAELLEIADQSLTRLSHLVEDLLDMSRLQAGALRPRLTPLDALDVLSPALESLPGGADRVHVEPPAPGTATVLADGPLLERVLANLLANAIKHTDSQVTVRTEPGRRGVLGERGEGGEQGVVGERGAEGVVGAQGAQGVVGAQGAQGAVGAQGVVSAQGEQSASGEHGRQGLLGESGERGAFGRSDERSVSGKSGESCVLGTSTEPSLLGASGESGVLGTSGGPDAVVRILVSDHGPGIPPSARDLVFRPFQRLGDRDNSTGVGLGLALARGLAESMGGTLVPEETPGGGVTMVLTLPAGPVAAQTAASYAC
ncbi:MAG TPA: DUF4118 domain-containing protein [Actinospica sp.]|nr:DUF4118 domain-containing protein [Actinospica sp.]HWG22971.1 DUF4118 domain-containing protein [Actinospica sp.]